jgi:NAD(P)-dependent dehydrogenase (short-subunit alcohol dehydrogenase family)
LWLPPERPMKKASSAEARRQGEHITDTALRLDDPPRPRAEGGTAHVEPGDLMDPAAVKRIGAAINDKIGRLDILVNNAGVNINDRHWDKLTRKMLS